MDRYEELDRKRRGAEGVTEDEAMELGRLDAERAGREYEGNAEDPPPEVLAERGDLDSQEELERAEARPSADAADDDRPRHPRRASKQLDTPPPA